VPACVKWQPVTTFTRACCTIGGDRYARVGLSRHRLLACRAAGDRDAASQAGTQAAAGDAAARCREACRSLCLSQMWWRAAPAGRRRDRGAGLRAGLVPRHPSCAAEAVVPELRVDRPGAGAQSADPSRPGQSWPTVARAGGEKLRPPAAVIARPRSTHAKASSWTARPWPTGLDSQRG